MAKHTDKAKRPQAAKPEFEGFPADLIPYRRWVLWRFQWRDDKTISGKGAWTKVPYQPNGRPASSMGVETWSTLAVCINALDTSRSSYDGIGFVFTDTPFAGIDLDECVTHDEENAEYRLTAFSARVVERLQTYTEFSVSKTGLHMIGLASDIAALKTTYNGNEIESYCTGRYFTFTGISWHTDPLPVRDIQSDLTDIVDRIRAKLASPKAVPVQAGLFDERLQMALRVQGLFKLFNGDTSEYDFDDSRADYGLCRWLAYYADGNADLLDSMFRKSKLYRGKWDERRGDSTYGQITIGKAIESQKNTISSRRVMPKRESSYEGRKARRYTFDALWEAAMRYRHGEVSEGVESGDGDIATCYRPRQGLLSVIIGDPGSGKSTIVDTWAYHIARKYNWKFTFASFETQPIERHILDLCQIHLGKPTFAFMKDEMGRSIAATDAEMEQARKEINQWFNFIGPDDNELTLDGILPYIDDDIKDYGINGFVLDPFSELDQTRDRSVNQSEFTERELRKLRSFTRHREIHTWLIVHPTKAAENRIDGRPTLYSANGSAQFNNKADYGLVVHVNADGSTSLYVDKVRFSETGVRGSKINYIYDTHARRYMQMNDED